MELFSLIREGGFIMYPLVIGSLLIWAVAIEKFIFLIHFKKQYLQLHKKAVVLISEQKFHEAKGLCHSAHPYISAPYLAAFQKRELPHEEWEGRLLRRLTETRLGLKRFLWILGTIASSAPFIGLFGTVVGIIKSFDNIAATGQSGFAVVASGLSEALIATAAGILVAVMAVIFYNFFQTKLAGLNLEFRNSVADLADGIDRPSS
jgi:biopolymer transport protein ExbB